MMILGGVRCDSDTVISCLIDLVCWTKTDVCVGVFINTLQTRMRQDDKHGHQSCTLCSQSGPQPGFMVLGQNTFLGGKNFCF